MYAAETEEKRGDGEKLDARPRQPLDARPTQPRVQPAIVPSC
jgi:hypothetical protein